MKRKNKKNIVTAVVCALMCLFSCIAPLLVYGETAQNNRYNVVIVLDASHSVEYTDPECWRFEAIEQFTGLLAEQGNHLGGIVFSDGVETKVDISEINNSQDKLKVTETLSSIPPCHYTNIGMGLNDAVDMLNSKGDPNLPSVIILISDGNTEMRTDKGLEESLELKADAIEKARDNDIPIYCVCLNANGRADVSEMQQISDATGGVFQEVVEPEDLKDVLNMFYDLIYRTSTITLVDEVFPDDGIIEKKFTIPSVGVEEINIIISGNPTEYWVVSPDGNKIDCNNVYNSDSFLMLKITEVIGGQWTFGVKGISGEQIKINMVYNTDIGAQMKCEALNGTPEEGDEIPIIVNLISSKGTIPSSEYNGFEAVLEISNVDGEVQDSVAMSIADEGFVTSYAFSEGVYFLKAKVNGYDVSTETEIMGPLTVGKKEIINTTPIAKENPIKETVYIWPFREVNYSINLSELAYDEQGDPITYKIISSSFILEEDYTVENNTLTQTHFSLRKGSYTVRATDSGGLYCDIELKVASVNVGIVTIIVLAIVALITLAIFGILLYIALTKPFNGDIHVGTNRSSGEKHSPRRGRYKLSMFSDLPNIGCDIRKSYFQASGDRYIELVTDVPVYVNGQKARKFRIDSSESETLVSAENDSLDYISVRFKSFLDDQYLVGRRRRNNFFVDVFDSIADFFSGLFGRKHRW